MKQAIFFLMAGLNTALHLNAQNCIDTVHIKGYYIIAKVASELKPEINHKGNITTIENRIDMHRVPSFVPCDSISNKHPLSYWLNHFFDDTKQVYISCEKFGIKYFLTKECLPEKENKYDTCSFPILRSKSLYQTTNLNTGNVFEIYFIDAFWAKVKIKSGSPEADLIPSAIAQRCISTGVTEFNLFYFIRSNNAKASPSIKDAHIKIWKN